MVRSLASGLESGSDSTIDGIMSTNSWASGLGSVPTGSLLIFVSRFLRRSEKIADVLSLAHSAGFRDSWLRMLGLQQKRHRLKTTAKKALVTGLFGKNSI